MEQPSIYHNPRCSKSRACLNLLFDKGFEPTIIEYMKNPLSIAKLETLATHFNFSDFVRTNEKAFKESNLSLTDKRQVLKAIQEEPKLLQRPIVTFKGKAIIARPAEKVNILFEQVK